jgi:lipoate-protein ligase A
MGALALFQPPDRGGVLAIAYFHAMARLGIDGLVLIEPTDTFVSVGYFDETQAVLDVARCRELGLPIVRREVGGGPVLLGPGQVFYNLVLERRSPILATGLSEIYRQLSAPAIEAYAKLGVTASYRPINDLVAPDGRKISGQGAADIEDRFCFVGAILRFFDVELMASVLRVDSEKFRDKLHKVLGQNVSSLEGQTGSASSTGAVVAALVSSFERLLGPLEPKELPAEAVELARQLAIELQSDECLFAATSRRHRSIKIREGVEVRHGLLKTEGGLLRAEVVVLDGVIADLELSSDASFVPKDAFRELGGALCGTVFDPGSVAGAVASLLERWHVDCPGVTPVDFAAAITGSRP